VTSQPGPVAFVLSSGANLGAVQVGMLRALIEHDIRPDLVVGCSIGAINGAGLAEDPTDTGVARLESLWQAMDGRDLMPRRWLPPPIVLAARRRDAVHTQDALAAVLRRTLAADRFEDLAVPFQCVATDIAAEREAWFSEGPLVEALLASAAIPAVYPLVEIDGRRYLDGAVLDEVPVRRAAELGARTLYVLEVGPMSRTWVEPRRPLEIAIQAYWMARRHRYQRELELLPPGVVVHALPHGDPPPIRLHDFTRTAELIEGAYRASTAYLDAVAPATPDAGPSRPPGDRVG
jgi:NTE family protein